MKKRSLGQGCWLTSPPQSTRASNICPGVGTAELGNSKQLQIRGGPQQVKQTVVTLPPPQPYPPRPGSLPVKRILFWVWFFHAGPLSKQSVICQRQELGKTENFGTWGSLPWKEENQLELRCCIIPLPHQSPTMESSPEEKNGYLGQAIITRSAENLDSPCSSCLRGNNQMVVMFVEVYLQVSSTASQSCSSWLVILWGMVLSISQGWWQERISTDFEPQLCQLPALGHPTLATALVFPIQQHCKSPNLMGTLDVIIHKYAKYLRAAPDASWMLWKY